MAERGLSSTLQTALSSANANIAFLLYLNLLGAAVRCWSGEGSIAWNSQTWLGLGKWGTFDKFADTVDPSDVGIVLTLNYLDDTLRNEITTNDSRGRDASLYIAAMNLNPIGVADAYEIFHGYIDGATINDSGSGGSLQIRLRTELALLQRPRFFTLTDAHQQLLFTGDVGLQFASKMDEPITWGRQTLTPLSGPGIAPVPGSEPYPGYNDQYLFPMPGSPALDPNGQPIINP
jgi:hypothetical protein